MLRQKGRQRGPVLPARRVPVDEGVDQELGLQVGPQALLHAVERLQDLLAALEAREPLDERAHDVRFDPHVLEPARAGLELDPVDGPAALGVVVGALPGGGQVDPRTMLGVPLAVRHDRRGALPPLRPVVEDERVSRAGAGRAAALGSAGQGGERREAEGEGCAVHQKYRPKSFSPSSRKICSISVRSRLP